MLHRNRLIALFAALIAAAGALACAVPGLSQPTPTLWVMPTLAPVPGSKPGETTPEAPSTGEAVSEETTPSAPYFDPCVLLTPDEASAVLGSAAQSDSLGIAKAFGGCNYSSEDYSKSVTVSALYGDEAKGLLQLGIIFAYTSTDEPLKAAATDLASRSGSMSIGELLTELETNPIWRAEDSVTPEAVSGIGDAAFWEWKEDELTGDLTVGSGDHYVAVQVRGFDQATARSTAETLARQALDRLPTDPFRTLNPPTATPTP